LGPGEVVFVKIGSRWRGAVQKIFTAQDRDATTFFGTLAPQRRRVRRLPIALLVGASVLGTITGVVIHEVSQVAASPQGGGSTTTVPQSQRSSVAATAPLESPGKGPGTNETRSTGTPPNLPRSAPLDDAQFVVPRGPVEAQRLDVARLNSPVATKRLKTPKGHRVNSPTLSVDRRTIIYIDRTANRLRTVAADGTGDRVLFSERPSGCATIGHASWNRTDQNQLVMRCTSKAGRRGLFVVTLKGDMIRRLDLGNVRMDDPAISPDGTLVAFWMADTRRRANGGGIVTMPLDGSAGPTWLTVDRSGRDADPAWSPDGTRIAFRRSTVNSRFDVYVMNVDGSQVKRLVGGPGTEEKPAWSPDGSRLLTVSDRADPGRVQGLYVVSFSGGEPKPLGLEAEVVTTPVWASR
jgi:Tol biopolymer transport system component